MLTCWLGGKGEAIPTIFKAPDPAGRKLQHPTGGVPLFPLLQRDRGLASIPAVGSSYGEAAEGGEELPPAQLPRSHREAQACAENTPSFLLGYFTSSSSSSLLGSCASAYTAGRKRKKSSPAQKSMTNSALRGVVAHPPTAQSPVPPRVSPGGFAPLQSLEIYLFLAAPVPLPRVCWPGTHRALCPHPPTWPPRSSPRVFGAGGPPHSPASSGGALSGTQVSYYSLLEGYYRLTHLENYSFFRPFRNFNELF